MSAIINVCSDALRTAVRANDAASVAVNVSAAARASDTALAAAYKTGSQTEARTFDGSGNCAVWSMRRTTWIYETWSYLLFRSKM